MELIEEASRVGEPTPTPGDFTTWVQARGPALQRFAHLVTGGAVESADLVQEALSRAYPRWRSLSRTDTAEAYVRRSIVNASISGWRRTNKLVVVADLEPHAPPAPDPAVGLTDADHAWRLCANLPVQQRAAVVLRFYEDLSFAQIADILGCAEATARSHVYRAVATLRATLAEEDPDD